MKIGLVTPYIYPLPGGVNAHVRYLYENLIARGHDVRIISSVHGPQRTSEGDVIRLGYGFSVPANGSVGTLTFSPRYQRQVREMLERERFDVLHFHEPFVPFLSLVLLRESTEHQRRHVPCVRRLEPCLRVRQALPGEVRTEAAWTDRGQCGGAAFHRPLLPGRLQDHPQRCRRGRDWPMRQPIARYRDGTLNILFLGRFESRKGAMYLLKAYRQVRKRGIKCRLLLVGTGPQEKEIRRYIATRRLGGVELLGRISDDDKARYFATADVFVSPATGSESFGIVLLEAMAAGKPIVCSDIHGYKGVVRRDEQAILVPPKDVKALTEALTTVLRDPEMRARMGASGRERVVQYGWENITAKVEDYYRFVIRRAALPRAAAATRRSQPGGDHARTIFRWPWSGACRTRARSPCS